MSEPRIFRMEQGTAEWHDVRLGIPTSSKFDKILTPAKLALSSQSVRYRNELLADWLAGYPASEMEASDFMERGTELEPRAREFYAFERSAEVDEVGFILHPNSRTGCSPDGVVTQAGEVGGLEIKTPALHTHVGYLLDPDSLTGRYRLQVQGSLWVTGWPWWDVISFSPVLPSVIRRVEPDPEAMEALDEAMGAFCDDLDDCKRRLADYREVRPDGFQSPMPDERSELYERLEAVA